MTFVGRAIYDTGIWSGIAEDVSDIISMISPSATPLLAAVGDALYPATSVYHEWLEEKLTPDTIVSSMTISTTVTGFTVHESGSAIVRYIMPGTIIKNKTTGEFMQVASTSSGNTLVVTRAFAGTTAATVTAGDYLAVIAPAALEGADVSVDISRPRTRQGNYCQIFKSDIIVSGTEQAVSHIGVGNEFEHQKVLRTLEAVRDLEKAVILNKTSGNSIGSATAYRTFKGLWDYIATNATSAGTLTTTILDNAIQNAWGYGADDLDLIVCDAAFKRIIDGWNSSRIEVTNTDTAYRNLVTYYQSTFGAMPVILSRYMPTNSCMVLATARVKVVPLQSRSFQFKPVSVTGDSEKGMVIGEYTIEVRNEEGMCKIY